jgi:hypothetical protein
MTVITKGFVVSMLVFVCILFGGGLLFRDSEAGTQATTAAAFLICSALLVIFPTLEKRRGRRKR